MGKLMELKTWVEIRRGVAHEDKFNFFLMFVRDVSFKNSNRIISVT